MRKHFFLDIFVFLALFLNQSCSNNSANSTNMEQQIAAALSAKYAEDFKVTNANFESGLNLYVFDGSPKSNSNIVFEGRFDERKENTKEQLISDSYPNAAFSEAAKETLKKAAKKEFNEFAEGASVFSYYEHPYGEKLITFDTYLKDRPSKSTIFFDIYLFETPTSADDKMIDGIKELTNDLQGKYKNNYSLLVSFWNKEMLGGKSISNNSFGFDNVALDDADNLDNQKKYKEKEFHIKVQSGSVEALDKERIFEIIKDRKPGPPRSTKI